MTRITVDATLRTKLHNLTEPLELCDDSGQVRGRFFPTPDLSRYDPESLQPGVTEEELRRRADSPERTYSTGEVLEHLERS
jgi:hypothetical protein